MKKALVIDDSETMRSMASMILRNLNFDVDAAPNGEIGVEKFKSDQYDFVITDINMPRLNGIQVIKQVREINKETPILVLTTESEDTLRKQGFQEGANGWVVKPFKPLILAEIVNQLTA